jgi:hypothetical protein
VALARGCVAPGYQMVSMPRRRIAASREGGGSDDAVRHVRNDRAWDALKRDSNVFR